MATHTYWRIYISKTSHVSRHCIIYEVEMRGAIGGADLCSGGTGTASGGANVYALFDNSLGTAWQVTINNTDSWVKYQFASPVEIKQIALNSYNGYEPVDFKLQYSDNDSTWTDAYAWTGVTGWVHQAWKVLTPIPPVPGVKKSVTLPWIVLFDIKQASSLPWEVGHRVQLTLSLPWACLVAKSIGLPYSLIRVVGQATRLPYALTVAQSVRVPIYYSCAKSVQLPYALLEVKKQSIQIPYGTCDRRQQSCRVGYALLTCNLVKAHARCAWEILETESPLIYTTLDAYLVHQGRKMPLTSASIGISEGDYAWTGQANIAEMHDFGRLKINDQVTLRLGEDDFVVLVDTRTMMRDGESFSASVALISPTARLAAHRATPQNFVVNTPLLASDAALLALGQPITWQMLDWTIPGGRLAFDQATPINMVTTLAHAIGGTVETTPDGDLLARHRFPVRVPDWDTATPDHVLTDNHLFSVQESYQHTERTNRVTIREQQPSSSGRLSIVPDDRPVQSGGLNRGSPAYYPGGMVHVLVHTGPGVSNVNLRASAGELWPDPIQQYQDKADLVFSDTNTVTLPHPVQSIDAWGWLGGDLGSLRLAADGVTVTADTAGLSVARVTVTVRAHAWKLIAPKNLNGEARFPIALIATATDGDTRTETEIIVQRGDGEYPGLDIIEPLAATVDAKRERGRAVIDAGEVLQEVMLSCVFDASIRPGHLIEVQDALMGMTWRGKVTGIKHTFGETAVTALEVLRHVDA